MDHTRETVRKTVGIWWLIVIVILIGIAHERTQNTPHTPTRISIEAAQ